MSAPDDRTPLGEPEPPWWDAPPQPPAWDRPAGGPSGWGPPPPYAQGGDVAGYGPGYAPVAMQLTEPKAVVALVLAVGSFVVLPLLPAVAALLLARSSRRDIDASGGRYTGTGLLTAARVLSWINVGLCLLALLLLVLGFALFASVGFS